MTISNISNNTPYLVSKLSVTDKCLENMEIYGVAYTAKKFGIPCSSILKVTNYCNMYAHQDWLANKNK